MKFNVLQASVRAYQRNLNTHSSYKGFRLARAKLRDLGKPLDSIILSEYLDEYAETGEKYVEILKKIIDWRENMFRLGSHQNTNHRRHYGKSRSTKGHSCPRR